MKGFLNRKTYQNADVVLIASLNSRFVEATVSKSAELVKDFNLADLKYSRNKIWHGCVELIIAHLLFFRCYFL